MGKWINVKDRLPEVGTVVLTWKPERKIPIQVVEYSEASRRHIEYIRRDGQWWDDGRQITYWQPSPEPPDGE